MQKLSDLTIKQSLDKEGVLSLYLVAGTDAFLIDSCVKLIAKATLGESRDGVVRFGPKTLEDGAFEELFYSLSMLSQQRVAVVEDAGAIKGSARKLLEEMLPQIPEHLTVVLRSDSDDRRFTLPKSLQSLAELHPRNALVTVLAKEGGELLRYIDRLVRREGCTAEDAAVREISALCGSDLMLISNEVKKLAALSAYGKITRAHVEALGIRTAEAGVYKMISALESGQTRQALDLLGELLDDLAEPLSVTGVINTAFINLYRAKLARDAGHSSAYMVDHFEYRKGDRRLAIAYERCTRYSQAKLETIIALLFTLDQKLKSSTVDSRILIEQKVVEISAVVAS